MNAIKSVAETPIAGDDRVAETFAKILRVANLTMTDAELEAHCGVKACSLKAYRNKERMPSLVAALSIVAVLGDKAVNSLLHVIRYQAKPLEDGEDLQPMQLVADSMTQMSVIAQAAADGRIDHTEAPMCMEAADLIIAKLLPISSAGKAA